MITAKQDSYWQHKSLLQDDTSTCSLITAINKIIIMTLPCSPFLKKAIQIQIFWLKNIPSSFSSLTKKEVTPALLGKRRAYFYRSTYAAFQVIKPTSQACVLLIFHLLNSAVSELSSGIQSSAACPCFGLWVQSRGLQPWGAAHVALWKGDATRCWPGVTRRDLSKRPEGDPGN